MERLISRRVFLKSALGGLALTAAAVATAPLIQAAKLPISNPVTERERFDHTLRSQPVEYLIMGGLVRPPLEELVFRFIPDRLLHKSSPDLHLKTGLVSSLVFAALHQRLHPDRLPISELMAGITYWIIMRKFGFRASSLAHMSTNTSLIALGLGLPKP